MSIPSFLAASARLRVFGFGPAVAVLVGLLALGGAGGPVPPSRAAEPALAVRLDGHVLPALAQALDATKRAADAGPLALTVVLKRDDEDGFRQFLADVYDPASGRFRAFLSGEALADRYGPSRDAYAAVRAFFAGQGFAIADESADRMTLTVRADHAQVERALDLRIGEYRIGEREFHANDRDPSLPADIAAHVRAIAGLSNLAVPGTPGPLNSGISGLGACYKNASTIEGAGNAILCGIGYFLLAVIYDLFCLDPINWLQGCSMISPFPGGGRGASPAGNPQTVGIVAFDSFDMDDVADFLAYTGAPADRIGQVSLVDVSGGTTPGANASEVLLDIDTILTIAPSAAVVVYSAPFSGNTSFQALFNRMIDDGVTVISNSWAYCEDQTSLADVESIDAILATAAAAGISVFNASGDTGSTCLDGSPNTVAVPAGSPHATAVGGTSVSAGDGLAYGGESWWNGASSVPVTGQGGFGASRYFARPSYQDGFTASAMRSVPDLAVSADPAANGVPICQASAGGCPSGLLYGGTSIAAPTMAAFTALLNAARGSNLGLLNPQIYPLAATPAFHPPSSMGSDFAHVGLGSPNVSALHLALDGGTAGPASATLSIVSAVEPVAVADPALSTSVLVQLRDANGSAVAGKTVQLSASAGSHAVISPPTAVSSAANGVAAFSVTDGTLEDVVFRARSLTDGVNVAGTATVRFVAPPAASGGIMAFPTGVPADGASATSITVTLHDAQDRPTPGKRVTIAQDGHSVVVGPNPPETDANGQIVFTATDGLEETVTYTAVDETDGSVPVPGTAVVTFSGSAVGSCVVPPAPGDGYALTPFANGFAAYPFFFGNVNWGCRGATDAAFDANGNAYVSHFPTGALYKFGPDGGSATAPLSTGLGPALGAPVFGRDGRLYATHGATTGDFFTGDIVEIDPATGEEVRVLASNLTCPDGLAIDPLSGDLFFDDGCFGAGSENPGLFRIVDPAGANPQLTTYATLPFTPNGRIAFSPDGTIYVETGYLAAQPIIVAITGTDQPQPPIVATLPDVYSLYWVNVGAALPSGAARSLIVLQNDGVGGNDLNLVDITTTPMQTTTLAHDIGSGVIGPDGCLYTALQDIVYKIAPESGGCNFATTNPSPALALSPRVVSPDPAQGTSQTLTATVRNLAVPAGTPVFLDVGGANEQVRLARTGADGTATFEYRGTFAGDDVVVARATVAGETLVSNVARITWSAGPHATSLGFVGATGGVAGQPATVSAALVDAAADPQAAIAGAAVQFSVGGASCGASTAANGIASCAVTLAVPGAYTLTASYAGSSQFLPASASTLFVVPTDGIDLIFADGFDGN